MLLDMGHCVCCVFFTPVMCDQCVSTLLGVQETSQAVTRAKM